MLCVRHIKVSIRSAPLGYHIQSSLSQEVYYYLLGWLLLPVDRLTYSYRSQKAPCLSVYGGTWAADLHLGLPVLLFIVDVLSAFIWQENTFRIFIRKIFSDIFNNYWHWRLKVDWRLQGIQAVTVRIGFLLWPIKWDNLVTGHCAIFRMGRQFICFCNNLIFVP